MHLISSLTSIPIWNTLDVPDAEGAFEVEFCWKERRVQKGQWIALLFVADAAQEVLA